MNLILFFVPAVAAGLLSYALAPLARLVAERIGAVDLPGPRKIHQHPIPRLGGLAVVAAAFAVAAVFAVMPFAHWSWPPQLGLGVGLGLLPIIAVSMRDDVKPMRPGPKFAAHILGACVAVACGVSLNGQVHLFGQTIAIGFWAWPLSVLWIVGATNAFNIVDGLDGLSAGLALISALSLAVVFTIAGEIGVARAVLVLAGALAGFLPYNVFPARMFLGDTGATAAGFCLAAFALRGGATLSAGFATLLPVLILGLPIAETLISMARRMLRRMSQGGAGGMFDADGNHMHHRLLALGFTHARAVQVLYGAGLVLASAALLSMLMTAREAALLLVSVLLAGIVGLRRLGYDEFAIIRNGTAIRVYDAPVANKSMFVVFVDLVLVAISVYCAIVLKTDSFDPRLLQAPGLAMVAVLAPMTVIVFWRLGLYRGSWRLAGVEEFVRGWGAVMIATLLGLVVQMVLVRRQAPFSLFAIYGLVSVVLVTASRASYQVLLASQQRARTDGLPTLIYGAGQRGANAVRGILSNLATELRPVGFIDDDPAKSESVVSGVPVIGSIRTFERAVRSSAARAVVVSSEAIPEGRLAKMAELCERLGVALLKMQVRLDLCAAPAGAGPWLPEYARAGSSMSFSETARAEGARAAGHVVTVNLDANPAGWSNPIADGVRSALRTHCPCCRSFDMHRSHAKNMVEEFRKRLTAKRLYRCEQCGWRGWAHVLEPAPYEPLPLIAHGAPPLDSFDAVLQ